VTGPRIRAKRNRLQVQLLRLQGELAALQTACVHPSATKRHGANTGNYDPSADWYWTDFNCPDCGKSWTLEGSL
jgi:hypothetical protein